MSKTDILQNMNGLINDLKKGGGTQICDAKCQQSGQREKYHNEYQQAVSTLKQGPDIVKKAEKNYYEKTNQGEYYNTLKLSRAKNFITKKVSILENAFNEDLDKLINLVNMMSSQNVYRRNMNDLNKSYKKDLSNLNKEVDKTSNTRKINNRLAYFYNEQNESWFLWINSYLWYIYIVLIGLIFIKFIMKKEFKNIKKYPILIVLLGGTYIINYIYDIVIISLGHFKLDISYLVFIFSFIIITFVYNKIFNFSNKN
jgi:hypothetical protein